MSANIERVSTSAVVLGVLLLCGSSSALALNPALDVSQYAHTAWRVREGFTKGPINAIAQTLDGYLWLGTDVGLFRFDGTRNVAWQPPADQTLPSTTILSLLATRDGALWIGTPKGLSCWKGGRLTHYPELAGKRVNTLIEDHKIRCGRAQSHFPAPGRSVRFRRASFGAKGRSVGLGLVCCVSTRTARGIYGRE